MERKLQLNKLTTLFKSFLTNKKHRIITKNSDCLHNQALLLNYEETNYLLNKREKEYTDDDYYEISNEDIDYINKYSNLRLDTNRGEVIPTKRRSVEINFECNQKLILIEEIKPQPKSPTTTHHVKWNNIFRRIFVDDMIIDVTEYEPTLMTRKITFGSISIELSEKEFNELFDFAKQMADERPNEIDEQIIDDLLKDLS